MRFLVVLSLAAAQSPNCPCVDADFYDWSSTQTPDNGLCNGNWYGHFEDGGPFCVPIKQSRGGPIGTGTCETWDDMLTGHCVCDAENCDSFVPKPWCADSYCYVDPDRCDADFVASETFFYPEVTKADGSGKLYYSYATCGGSTSDFARWSLTERATAADLILTVEGYLESLVEDVHATFKDLNDGESDLDACEAIDSCDCDTCRANTCQGWSDVNCGRTGQKSCSECDFGKLSITYPRLADESSREIKLGKCMGQNLEYQFKQIVKREYSSSSRVAYIYFGTHNTGLFAQWPAMTWCPNAVGSSGNYDPRFRPWYVVSATGPKDIVIILDKSGSMQTQTSMTCTPDMEWTCSSPPCPKICASGTKMTRWEQAQFAIKKLLLTFADYDYVGIVAFSGVTARPDVTEESDFPYEERLVKTTKNGKLDLEDWVQSKSANGGTDFYQAFDNAFEVLLNSQTDGKSSRCSPIMLFMTDGVDESGRDMLDEIAIMQGQLAKPVPIHTYTFGEFEGLPVEEQRKAQLPVKIACANKGIGYEITDGGDLASTMSDYYRYWANSVPISEATSPSKRWVKYIDAGTGDTELFAGCSPIYDPLELLDGDVNLLGVVCMDINMIIDLEDLEGKADYFDVYRNKIDVNSKSCITPRGYSEVELQELRGSSRCSSQDMTKDQYNEIAKDQDSFSSLPMLILAAIIAIF